MPMRYPIILPLAHPQVAYRWRLVASVYDSGSAIVEGAAVLVMLLVFCALRAHNAVFTGLAVAAIFVTAARLWDRREFMRVRAEGGDAVQGTPEGWMRRQAIGALVTASLWGAQQGCVLLLTNDTSLQLASLMLESGWIAAASVRMAPCPAAVLGQIMLSLGVTVLCLFLTPEGLIWIAIPMGLINMAALLRISRSLGRVLMQSFDSEQRAETANTQLAEANEQLTRLSLIDGLTGIANRRAFDGALDVEWQRAGRAMAPLALLMIDVDCFKLYNDHYGHQAGDECLRCVAMYTAANLYRPADFAGRYGGEEFAVLLPTTDENGAFQVAERLRAAIAATNMLHEAASSGRVSVSIGVASLVPGENEDRQSLVRMADDALYHAKRLGRDRVQRAATPPHTPMAPVRQPSEPHSGALAMGRDETYAEIPFSGCR